MDREKICKSVLRAYFFVMAVVYPLYAPGGYLRIGEVKFFFFRNVTLVTLAVLGGILVLSAVISRDKDWILRHYLQMSVTDWFVYGYCLVVMLSYLCSPYKEDALWGAEGWYMGVISQMMFALLYFFFSRYFCNSDAGLYVTGADVEGTQNKGSCVSKWLGIWLAASAVVFLLGVCNRYSLYPIAMEGQTETFISTLGNINWFCGYWSIAAPIGIMLYWCSEKGVKRAALGAYSFLAMLSGVTQGSNSAYLVFLAMLFVLLLLSLQSDCRLFRFLELCILFTAACLTGRLMQELPGLSFNYHNYYPGECSVITGILISSEVIVWALGILSCCYIGFRVLGKRGCLHIERHKWLWCTLTAAACLTACIIVFLMMLDDEVIRFREVMSMEKGTYLEVVIDEDLGNGRGAAWMCSVDGYRRMDRVHKLVGIGPDCYADYIYDVTEIAKKVVDRFGDHLRLTNAHNEWLTVLVNTGSLGLFCYVGIFATAFVRFMRRAKEQALLYVCAMALCTYTAHNMVSFQQILSTPYIFMVLGIGEGLVRVYRKEKKLPESRDGRAGESG